MKKKQLETLEKINEDRKLDKETKEKIRKRVLKNFIFATVILLFFIILKLIAIYLEKKVAIVIYKGISIGILAITLFLFEVAYKKDSDSLAIISIEMFFLSIITLLTPYILINRVSVYKSCVGVFFAIYYAIKNFIIYIKVKNKYLKEKNDIIQIIKKESKDELAQEQLEKIKQEREAKVKKKTTTKKTSKLSAKTEQKDTTPKRKRGRPKKVQTEIIK